MDKTDEIPSLMKHIVLVIVKHDLRCGEEGIGGEERHSR